MFQEFPVSGSVMPVATPSSVLMFSTYIGGSDDDTVHSVAVDDNGSIYIAGTTKSNDLPSADGPRIPFSGSSDYFVMKLTNNCELVYTTYIGGTSADGIPNLHPDASCSIDVDQSGHVYMTGYTTSPDFPVVNAWDDTYNGNGDCFALKLSPSGDAIEYATFIGGNKLDMGITISVDDLGNAYISGRTCSSDFPTLASFDDTLGGVQDCFLLKLNVTGQIVYSTFVGGESGGEGSHPNGLVIDTNGNAYIIGWTNSQDFPTVNAFDSTLDGISSDVFFCKVSSAGLLLASSYYGGIATDENGGIAVDGEGNIYISGHGSIGYPGTMVLSDHPEIFVAKFDSSGRNLIYSSVFGGMYFDNPFGLLIDQEGCLFVTGATGSSDFPMVKAYDSTNNGLGDAFLTKLSSGGDNILFSSYVGGNSSDMGISLAKTNSGTIYLVGITNSTNFPTVSTPFPMHQNLDGFLVTLENSWPNVPPEVTPSTSTSSHQNPSTTIVTEFGLSSNEINLLLIAGIGIELVVIFLLLQNSYKSSRKSQ